MRGRGRSSNSGRCGQCQPSSRPRLVYALTSVITLMRFASPLRLLPNHLPSYLMLLAPHRIMMITSVLLLMFAFRYSFLRHGVNSGQFRANRSDDGYYYSYSVRCLRNGVFKIRKQYFLQCLNSDSLSLTKMNYKSVLWSRYTFQCDELISD